MGSSRLQKASLEGFGALLAAIFEENAIPSNTVARFLCYLGDFWCPYGSQKAPKMGLKRYQNRVRNATSFERPFLIEFGAVLGSMWILKLVVSICILQVFVDFGLSALGRAQVLQNAPQNRVS